MKSFAVFCAVVGCAVAAPAADPYVNGAVAGPLTAAFGDLVSTNRGLRPLSLEGFSEDVNQDGFVDPLAQAVAPVATYAAAPVVHAAPVATYAAAPVVHAAPVAEEAAAAPVVEVKAAEPVEVKVAAPVVHAAPVATYAAAPVVHAAPVVSHAAAVYHTVHHVPQVHVAKQTYTHTTHHVINHAPVVGSYISGLPVVGAPVVAAAEAEAAPVAEEAAVEAA